MADVAEKRRALQALPDDAQVPVGWIRELIDPGEPFDGVGTSEASEMTGLEPRKLRRLHRRWERQQDRGQTPRVRVSRKNPASARSDLLFDRGDLLRYVEAQDLYSDSMRLIEGGG